MPFIEAPADVKANMRVAEDTFDEGAVTSDSEPESSSVPPGIARDVKGVENWDKRGGRTPKDELKRAPAAAVAASMRAGRGAAPAPGTVVAGVPLMRGARVDATPGRPQPGVVIQPLDASGDGSGSGAGGADDGETFAVPDPEDLRAAGVDVSSGMPVFESPPSSDSGDEDGGEADELSDSSDDEPGVYHAADPVGVQRPSMTRRPEAYFVPGLDSAAAENDARLSEDAAALLAKHARGTPAPTSAQLEALLENDDDSDYGGDPFDPRFDHDPRIHAEDWVRLRGGRPIDADAEALLEVRRAEGAGRPARATLGAPPPPPSPAPPLPPRAAGGGRGVGAAPLRPLRL